MQTAQQVGSTIFSNHAASYEKGRPGYAPELTRFLEQALASSQIGADVGSGTGIFTRELLNLGKTVYALEPNPDMRIRAERILGAREGFISLDARAEETGLSDQSLDFITAASSFHWLDHEAFRREALRVLRPEGEVYVIFNDRVVDDPFSREQHAICERYCPRFTSLAHGWQEAQAAFDSFFAPGYQIMAFDFPLIYDRESFLERSYSSSYSLTQEDPEFPAYQRALEDCVDRYFPDGSVTIANVTRLCVGRPR